MQRASGSPMKHGTPAGASGNQRKEDEFEMEFGDSVSQQPPHSNPQLTKENLNKLPNVQQNLLRPFDSISNANTSQVRTNIMNSISRKIDQTKVRNFCPKHKLVYVNKCLQDGVNLCAECFKSHKDHKLQML